MPELVSIVAASTVALGISIATLVIARRAGLSDVDKQVNSQRGALVATLTNRVTHLESENERLSNENEYLKREIEQLRNEVQRLERYIIRHRVGDDADD